MSLRIPIIAEDSWVAVNEFRARRLHKVFATNGDVLTHCQRWLKRDSVVPADNYSGGVRCRLCERSPNGGAA